ncbi:hypothetical protein GCM10011390_37540 [Aureimonas endophytica]|uniref:Uncharacterized protein n=1 Tax=Aureimonas endophytica TaxID=2027858 RepID=A0A917E9V4_9HYPH|nr:hypothetical protein GCM10011390_37540 [Aureimonas endophytica]
MIAASALPSRGESFDDERLIDLWASQRSVCQDGDEKSPDTWMACGRSDAFAAVLAARGLCLDAGQDVWRVGNAASATRGEDHWRCSLVSS